MFWFIKWHFYDYHYLSELLTSLHWTLYTATGLLYILIYQVTFLWLSFSVRTSNIATLNIVDCYWAFVCLVYQVVFFWWLSLSVRTSNIPTLNIAYCSWAFFVFWFIKWHFYDSHYLSELLTSLHWTLQTVPGLSLCSDLSNDIFMIIIICQNFLHPYIEHCRLLLGSFVFWFIRCRFFMIIIICQNF